MLELAASLSGHSPVILGDAIPGLDNSIRMIVKAVLRASGQPAVPVTRTSPARKGDRAAP
jgi:hypothetical protein